MPYFCIQLGSFKENLYIFNPTERIGALFVYRRILDYTHIYFGNFLVSFPLALKLKNTLTLQLIHFPTSFFKYTVCLRVKIFLIGFINSRHSRDDVPWDALNLTNALLTTTSNTKRHNIKSEFFAPKSTIRCKKYAQMTAGRFIFQKHYIFRTKNRFKPENMRKILRGDSKTAKARRWNKWLAMWRWGELRRKGFYWKVLEASWTNVAT